MVAQTEDTLDGLTELGDKYREVCGSPKIAPPLTSAIKHDSGKPPMSLLSRTALEEISKVLEFGANKYAADNWRKGFKWRRTLDAAMRHLTAFMDGEDVDPESGLSHLAHLGCNIMFLLEFQKTHPELDDRYKPKFALSEKSEMYKELYDKLVAEHTKELNAKKYSPIQETM